MPSMSSLIKIEEERGISLPKIYKDFYGFCSVSVPQILIGTDLINQHQDLNAWAKDLLAGNSIDDFLDADDFVL